MQLDAGPAERVAILGVASARVDSGGIPSWPDSYRWYRSFSS
jgi:hypothetical protein